MLSPLRVASITLLVLAAAGYDSGQLHATHDAGAGAQESSASSNNGSPGTEKNKAQSAKDQDVNSTPTKPSKADDSNEATAHVASSPVSAGQPAKAAPNLAGGTSRKPKAGQSAKQVTSGSSTIDKSATDAVQAESKRAGAQTVLGSAVQNTAKQALEALDTAIAVAQKAGVPSPTLSEFTTKKNGLQQKANAAKDDQSWAAVLTDATAALSDILGATKAAAAAQEPASVPSAQDPKRSFWFTDPPLLLAVLSLAISTLSLWRGWFLARRQVNKALAEAGLL